MSSEDLDSDVDFSTDLGSTLPTTRDGDNNTEGTANFDEDTQHDGGMGDDDVMGDEPLYNDVAIAIPPTESEGGSEYHEIALTGSAALDVLDQLSANNAIGKEKAAKLRRKYNILRDTLESSRLMESNLLDKAKTLSHQLAYQRRVLEKGASFPDGSTTQSGHLRQVQLSHRNEMDLTQMRLTKLEFDIEQLTGERDIVDKELQRLPKKEELDQHIKELNKSVDELRDEISLRALDLDRYHTDLDKKNFRVTTIKQETEELCQMEESLQQDLITIRNGPNVPKEIEIIRRQHKEELQASKETQKLLDETLEKIEEARDRNSIIKAECTSISTHLRKEKETGIENEVELGQITRHSLMAKEREACLLEDKANLEIRERHRLMECRGLHEAYVAKMKDKDKELKSLKKVDIQVSFIKQSIEQVQRQVTLLEEKKLKQTLECDRLAQNRAAVRREVDTYRRGLQYSDGVNEADYAKLSQKLAAEEMTKKGAKHLRERLHNLNKDIIAMTKARDNESRLYFQTQKECKIITCDLHTKDTYIRDQQKKIRELEAELNDFMQAYEVVKNERNKTHSQILVMQQLNAELADKSKILTNEIGILGAKAVDDNKELQICSQSQSNYISERDLLRQELAKVKFRQVAVADTLDTLRESIQMLTQQIKTAEHDLHRLQRRYELTVQERNDLGLQLIERNDEMCMFYEKLNMQKSVIRKASLKLESREEEAKFLTAELKRLENELAVGRTKLPERASVEMELLNAREELRVCEAEMRELEKAVEDASNPSRLRLLPGGIPTRDELSEKLEKVEGQLTECEQQLMEKELLFEQVGKLTDRASRKVDNQRESTLTVAKKVNNYQSRIKDVTRKMMAQVSELSMQQASSLRLEQGVKELESQLRQAYTHMENGEPPDDKAQVEWEKMVQDENRRKQRLLEKMNLEEEQSALSGGIMTSAEQRPNAYMPTGEGELPIPKPYGSNAPFKPSQPGSNLRHIRKPLLQPIDI